MDQTTSVACRFSLYRVRAKYRCGVVNNNSNAASTDRPGAKPN